MNISDALAAAMGATAIKKRAVRAPGALNEACDYERPIPFRGACGWTSETWRYC